MIFDKHSSFTDLTQRSYRLIRRKPSWLRMSFTSLYRRELRLIDQYLVWGEDRGCFRDDKGGLRYLPTALDKHDAAGSIRADVDRRLALPCRRPVALGALAARRRPSRIKIGEEVPIESH